MKWPLIPELIKKVREQKREMGIKDEDNFNMLANIYKNVYEIDSILKYPQPENLIHYHDIFDPNKEKNGKLDFEELIDKYVKFSAKCYEIKSKTDENKIEIIYQKRYHLPSIFKRFYTV